MVDEYKALIISVPGARMSTHAPRFEKLAMASAASIAPTAMVDDTLLGLKRHASAHKRMWRLDDILECNIAGVV